jgi:hypothetical protein
MLRSASLRSDRSFTAVDNSGVKDKPFEFKALPPELRELVIFQASWPFPPIETNAINNTPKRVRIPSIAQLSRETRKEALAVFYRNREVIISLHCRRNVQRAVEWAKTWGDFHMSDTITIGGVMKFCENDWYHLTIKCSRDDPQFSVEARPHLEERPNRYCQAMRDALALHLDEKAARKKDVQHKGMLTSKELLGVLVLVRRLSDRHLSSTTLQFDSSQ